MRFEWDPEKARSNLAKHGLPFALAVAAFDDPFQLVVLDDRPYGEERWHCIASLPRGAIISIIFTERSADDGDIIIRVISLRSATRDERARDIERLLDDYAKVLAPNATDAIQDEDIDLTDHPAWTEEMFEKAERGTFYRPRTGEAGDALDADVIAWFRQRYPAYQAAMNAVLRAWIEAHGDEDAASEDTDHDHNHRKTA